MNTVSEKELSALNDLLSEEELLVKKFKMLAEHTQDTEIKGKFATKTKLQAPKPNVAGACCSLWHAVGHVRIRVQQQLRRLRYFRNTLRD